MRWSLYMYAALVLGLLSPSGIAEDKAVIGQKKPVAAQPSASAKEDAAKEEDAMADYVRLVGEILSDQDEKKEIFFYQCKHVSASTLEKILEEFLTPGGTVAEGQETDVVIVSDAITNLAIIEKIAKRVDQPVPQVLVQAHIAEFTIDSDFEKEVNIAYTRLEPLGKALISQVSTVIGTPGANPDPTQGALITSKPYMNNADGKERTLDVFLRYLETKGKARILSAPSLILRRGAEGSIITGEEVPILTQTVTSGSVSTSTKFKSVGIKLRVMPIMITDKKVHLSISPEVSTVIGFSSGGGGVDNPIIAVRNASTELDVLDGQLVTIGGLLRQEERDVRRRIPILGSIPILGALFRSERRETVQTQLVIFLTVRILREPPSGMLIEPSNVPQEVKSTMRKMENQVPIVDTVVEIFQTLWKELF